MKAGILFLLAALPILAGAQTVAPDHRFGKSEQLAMIAARADSSARPVRGHARSVAAEESARLAYGAFALAEEGTDGDDPLSRNVRLYSIPGDATAGGAASAARASAAKESVESARRVKNASLPEPGSWAMVLAGLLGVGAIARRRMSA